jgi:hypothetical protein
LFFTAELHYNGRAYQLTLDEESGDPPSWAEVPSYLVPTINLVCQLNRWFIDHHAAKVLAQWGKDHLDAYRVALRLLGANEADFLRLGLDFVAECTKQTAKPRRPRKATRTSEGLSGVKSTLP